MDNSLVTIKTGLTWWPRIPFPQEEGYSMAEHRLSASELQSQKYTPNVSIHVKKKLYFHDALTTSVHLSLTLPQGVPRLSSEFGGTILTCIILSLYLRSGPGHWKPVACWAPQRPSQRQGPSVTWGRKVKSAPCREVAASWMSSMKLWTPSWPLPVSQRWYFCLLLIFLVLISQFVQNSSKS